MKCYVARDDRQKGYEPSQYILEICQETHDLVGQAVHQRRQHGNDSDYRESINHRCR